MAKKSMVLREKKRAKLVNKHFKVRKELKEIISNLNASDHDRASAEIKLQKMHRDSSPSRKRNRCKLCGRSRAYNRLTGLCRIHMRHAVMNGFVPGMHKASW